MNDSTPGKELVDEASSSAHSVEKSTAPAGHGRQQSILRSFLLVVGIPTLCAAIYYGLIVSDVYISETRYAIRTSDEMPSGGLLTQMLGGTAASGGGSDDAKIVRDYILSRDMLDELNNRIGLREHYTSSQVDWLSRLENDASEEDLLEYYREKVEVGIDGGSDITTLRVRAFTPEVAQEMARSIIELSERLVNRLSARIINDTLYFARKELDLAEQRVRDSSTDLTRFRNDSRLIDPAQETSAVLSIVTGLEVQLAEARAELIEAESYMRADSARVNSLRTRVAAIERQVRNERQRLANESGTDLTKHIDSYEPLILEQQLAEQLYASALTSLEVARADAQRRQRYLIPFVEPELPDEALEPERVWSVVTVFFGACLVFAIGGLVWSAINEHLGA